MARSAKIYVVMEDCNEIPVAGFTVKHELITWLKENEDNDIFELWGVFSVNDGVHQKPSDVQFLGSAEDLIR